MPLTIHFDLARCIGVAASAIVRLEPRDTPLVAGALVVVTSPVSVTLNSSGIGTAVIQPGHYDVTFRGIPNCPDRLHALIPDGDSGTTIEFASTLVNDPTSDYSPIPLYDAAGSATAAVVYSIQRSHHTGSQVASTISDFTAAVRAAMVGVGVVWTSPNGSQWTLVFDNDGIPTPTKL